jgi:hypothetical protein
MLCPAYTYFSYCSQLFFVPKIMCLLLFCFQGRDANPDLATSPRRQPQQQMQQQTMGGLRPREPPPMVIQGDFRKVNTEKKFISM